VLDEHDQIECLVASVHEQPAATAASDTQRSVAANTAGQSEQLQLAVAGFAHDINNLLTVMSHYQSFVAEGRLSPQQTSDLKSAREATQSGVALASRLLLLSKGQRATGALVDANDIVSGAAKMLRPVLGEAIQLSIELSAAPLPVRAGIGEVEQVIINLAFNSRDAMLSGPLAIRTASAIVTEGDPLTSELAPGKYAVISVKDAGPGIDAGTLSRIFEPYFTTKALCGGTGLGLFMVKDVVTRLGGAVRIETAPGLGCEFFIYIPLFIRFTGYRSH
jgi:signal transduction histidine kinase